MKIKISLKKFTVSKKKIEFLNLYENLNLKLNL